MLLLKIILCNGAAIFIKLNRCIMRVVSAMMPAISKKQHRTDSAEYDLQGIVKESIGRFC